MEIEFKNLVPAVDEGQAAVFLERLTRDTSGYIALNLIDPNGKILADFSTVAGVHEVLATGSFFTELIKFGVRHWNVYVGVGAFKVVPEKGSRGYANQIGEIPGVWADFDVKPGQADAFQTQEEIEDFLLRLPPATMRVDTGSGGIHAYWLFGKPMLDMTKATKLLSSWHAYLHEEAGGRHVDNVQELARIMRVAGTVRWPKKGETHGVPAAVRLVHANGPEYTPDELMTLAAPARRRALAAHKVKVDSFKEQTAQRQNALYAGGQFVTEHVRDDIERTFNQLQDWAVLLERAGWTLQKDGRATGGSSTAARYWSQPGMTHGYSAMTDFRDSEAMVFYTTHPDWDEVAVPHMIDRAGRRMTTKYNFALHGLFNGDERALLMEIVKGKGELA